MLRGPDRLHFSSDEIILKITCADHVYLIKDNTSRDIVQKGPLKIVQPSYPQLFDYGTLCLKKQLILLTYIHLLTLLS